MKNLQQHLSYWKKYRIRGGSWRKHHAEQNLAELGYLTAPWDSFGMSLAEWTAKIYGKKKTHAEHRRYWKKHNIKSSTDWERHRRLHNLGAQRYVSSPWFTANMTVKEWVESIWGADKTYEEHIAYWRKHKLTTGTYRKHWREHNLVNKRYFCNPWVKFNMTVAQWTQKVGGK